MLRKNTLLSLTTTVISIMLGMNTAVYAKLDVDSFSTTVITGAFYTDETGLDGVVTPWRLIVDYKQNLDPNIDIAVQMNSQTGITSGPYINGFNTETEKFRIETIKYTQSLSDSVKARLGLGKVKANVLKKGGSSTPLPFSSAMARLPLSPSDIAFGVQQCANNFNGAYTLGTAVSKISTQTQSDSREYSLFGEIFSAETDQTLWLQYSHNNLVKTINSDHYFSLGGDRSYDKTTLNGTIYVGTQKGFMGYDCGFKQASLAALYDANLGIGYGESRGLQRTLEFSLEKKLLKNFTTTLSWYRQWPNDARSFNVAGVKIEHKF